MRFITALLVGQIMLSCDNYYSLQPIGPQACCRPSRRRSGMMHGREAVMPAVCQFDSPTVASMFRAILAASCYS